ncbi:MAG TPA: hypothetical protein VH092_22280 [Urbifossiella sp.]|jgi:hypothetical protein|nr:hypothetical protein [Urbifossiella sp.]
MTAADWQDALAADGFVLLHGVFDRAAVSVAVVAWEDAAARAAGDPAILCGADGVVSGARDLFRLQSLRSWDATNILTTAW